MAIGGPVSQPWELGWNCLERGSLFPLKVAPFSCKSLSENEGSTDSRTKRWRVSRLYRPSGQGQLYSWTLYISANTFFFWLTNTGPNLTWRFPIIFNVPAELGYFVPWGTCSIFLTSLNIQLLSPGHPSEPISVTHLPKGSLLRWYQTGCSHLAPLVCTGLYFQWSYSSSFLSCILMFMCLSYPS